MGIRWSLIIRWQCEEPISPPLIWSSPQTREYIDWQWPLFWRTLNHDGIFGPTWWGWGAPARPPPVTISDPSTPVASPSQASPQHNVIFSRGFWWSVRGFLPLFFPFTKYYSWINSSLFISRIKYYSGRKFSLSLFEILNTKVLGHPVWNRGEGWRQLFIAQVWIIPFSTSYSKNKFFVIGNIGFRLDTKQMSKDS